MRKLKRVLLYSPDVIGHPRVYCRVIADALSDSPCELVVAMGFSEAASLADSPDLQPLVGRKCLQLVDTRSYSKSGDPHLTAEELSGLQTTLNIDTTLFIEADKSNAEFRRIAAGAAPRLRGRNIGIFANISEWYPGEDSFTGARQSILAPTIKTTLGNIKRLTLERRKHARYFFERIIISQNILDEVLVKDERLAEWRGPPVYWMPEISRPACQEESEQDRLEYMLKADQLSKFLAANQGREPLLYFGDAAYYKGYDLFLQFVEQNPDTCAIHAGRSYDEQQRSYFAVDANALREHLRAQGRLFENNNYVHSQRLKELFFGVVRVYITTHRLALSSSTVIQALELGKPVLVPDRGLIGYRVKANNLGGVYEYENLTDLEIKARAFWSDDLEPRRTSIQKFWERFSDESIKAFFLEKLVFSENQSQ